MWHTIGYSQKTDTHLQPKNKLKHIYIYIWPHVYGKKKLFAFELNIDKMLMQEKCIVFFSISAIRKWANKPLKSLI